MNILTGSWVKNYEQLGFVSHLNLFKHRIMFFKNIIIRLIIIKSLFEYIN